MTKETAFRIGACFMASVGVVLTLIVVSRDMKQRPGNFLRQFPPHPAMEGPAIRLPFDDYYIAGGTSHHVYLGNYAAPLHLIVINVPAMDTSHVQLKIENITREKFWSARVTVDSPFFYLTDGAVPRIYKGRVEDWSGERYKFDNVFFTDIVPTTPGEFAIRALGKPVAENILGKISESPPHIRTKTGILEKQVDGIFCTDGTMHFDRARNELIYSYFYRNEYIVLDTALNVLRRNHTIDTVTHADIAVEKIASTGEIKFSTPRRTVNRHTFPLGDRLFVNSMLLARNENAKAIGHATAVDVYRLSTGEYEFSFYVYDIEGERMRQFEVHGDKLYALFAHHFQVWNLVPAFFDAGQ